MVETIGLYNRRFRSVLSFVVALSLISLVCYLGVNTYQASHADFGPSMYVSPGAATVAHGSTLSVTIREQSDTEQVNSVQATMNYDTATLQFVSIAEGGVFPIASSTITTTPGVIKVARANSNTDIRGDKPIITVNFKVIGSSGTSAISFDKGSSFLLRSFDARNILQSLGGGKYNIIPVGPSPSSVAAPMLYINPSSGSYASGATITAAVRLNAHSTPVTTVEAAISYPTTRLQYMGVSEGGIFSVKQRTNASGGVADIIRAVPVGNGGIQGDNPVVKIMFKAIGTSGSAPLLITSASAAFDNSGSGTDILDLVGSQSAEYAIAPLFNNALGTASTITSPSQAFTISTKGTGGQVALTTVADGSTLVEISGQVMLSPVIDPGVAKDANDKVSRVEYYLGGKLISTQQTAPFSFKLDSNKMSNGTYTLTVKTYYHSGKVGSRSDKLLVKNKVTFAYVLHHYIIHILVLVVVLATLVVVVIKVVVPRLSGDPEDDSSDNDELYGFGEGKEPAAGTSAFNEGATVPASSTIAQPTAPATATPNRSVDGLVRPSTPDHLPKL